MLFELIFIVIALATVVALIGAVIISLRGRRASAVRVLRYLGIGWAVYLTIVGIVATTTRQRVIPKDGEMCFDEMCFSVARAERHRKWGQPATPRPRSNFTLFPFASPAALVGGPNAKMALWLVYGQPTKLSTFRREDNTLTSRSMGQRRS